MILPIYIFGQPVLRKVAEDITPDYPQLKDLISDMWETLAESEGIGLAAPQIGKAIRLSVIEDLYRIFMAIVVATLLLFGFNVLKMAITGNGAASKEQVAMMLQRTLGIDEAMMPDLLDATDALATALCHFYERNKPFTGKGTKSWKTFIAQHPDRVKK